MSTFFFQTKTSGTDQMTVRKDDKQYVLVETPVSTAETKEDSAPSLPEYTPHKLYAAMGALANARANGLRIARLPQLVANIERTHTFRYAWSMPAGSASVNFNANHIASPLAYATTTTSARPLFVSGRLRRVRMIWADAISTASPGTPWVAALFPPELSWYPAPGSDSFAKRETIIASPSTSAGGGDMTVTPPKNSFQSMWQVPTSATPTPLLRIEQDANTLTRAYIIDVTIDLVLIAGIGAANSTPALTVAGATADKVCQLVPLFNGSAAGDAQGYYTASY